MTWAGNYPDNFTSVMILFTTHASDGSPVDPSESFANDDVYIVRNDEEAKATTNGIVVTTQFASVPGLHGVSIDTSNNTGDTTFWVANSVYTVVLIPAVATVDGIAVTKVIGQFGLGLIGAANIKQVNDVTVTGDGAPGTEWGP